LPRQKKVKAAPQEATRLPTAMRDVRVGRLRWFERRFVEIIPDTNVHE
jgi:hypothetical protein